jgi:hypothetical protein
MYVCLAAIAIKIDKGAYPAYKKLVKGDLRPWSPDPAFDRQILTIHRNYPDK